MTIKKNIFLIPLALVLFLNGCCFLTSKTKLMDCYTTSIVNLEKISDLENKIEICKNHKHHYIQQLEQKIEALKKTIKQKEDIELFSSKAPLIIPSPEKISLPEVPSPCPDKLYIIKNGDWLSKIAKREYHDFKLWPFIWWSNYKTILDEGGNYDLLFPGMVLKIPVLELAEDKLRAIKFHKFTYKKK